MPWYVVYTVSSRLNRPNEEQYYKLGFEQYQDALQFFNNRKSDYSLLKVYPPDEIGFYPGGSSKDFLELLSFVQDEEVKKRFKKSDGLIITPLDSGYDITNTILRCPVCTSVFLDYINFQNHIRRCRNWMKNAPTVKCSC